MSCFAEWVDFRGRKAAGIVVVGCLGVLSGWAATGAGDLEAARKAFETGRYEECMALARGAGTEDVEEWGTLLTEALMVRGRYGEGLKAATNALARETRSIRLRWSAREALLATGEGAAAEEMTGAIQALFSSQYWRYRNARDLVVFGRVALAGGMEPKLALDRIYEAAKKADPKCPDPYIASGELALEKHDYALAARLLHEGNRQVPENPEILLGLAKAYAPSDQRLMLKYVERALERNRNHVGSLLLLADHKIDAEAYEEAEAFLLRVEGINGAHPEGWAYRAVLAHLRNDPEAERKARDTALKSWPMNPRVDHLIGLKLSQKYRFAEGSRHQRMALAFAPGYLPAKGQLAQDMLRLGEEEEGWKLADEVQKGDPYDVTANNLVRLQEVLAKYRTLTNGHFQLQMHAHEASIYGERALQLLERARTELCRAYGIEFTRPVLVEMFNDQKDFAVRTFGMPENDGFLGVCFGHVITANSPAAQAGSPFNWESMLWHEFCHVVTLQLTKNKMPRWMSEGISVYEERRANPAWGERLNPRYREMILGKDLTPVSKLSGAFLAPKSALHLQFAYYQSSLVVEYLVERHGREKLLAILKELGEGMEVNEALAKHTVPIGELESGFRAYAHKIANDMAPGVDWERPTAERSPVASILTRAFPEGDTNATPRVPQSVWEEWTRTRPTNYWVMLRKAEGLVEEKKWAEAQPLLERLVRLYPDSTGDASPYPVLAMAHRELGNTNAELEVLTVYAQKDDEATATYARLMELSGERNDWSAVLTNAQRYLGVNPLVPLPYRHVAKASEALGDVTTAMSAYRALLEMDPPNPADVHFNLARLLHEQGAPEARQHLLQALEEAPRFREALLLLKRMQTEKSGGSAQARTTIQ